jgi:chorismate mutase/prephenate dehydratase
MAKTKKALKGLRRQIDGVDSTLIKLLNKRAEISQKIGAVKREKEIDIYAPDRESQVYQSVIEKNSGPLADDTIRAIYREIMSGTLALEGPLKVAYLGPPATFTHQASLHKFGSSVSYVDCNTITDVFREVDNGRATYGVVPIENSIEGAVNHTLDMFIDFDIKICSEVYLEISHNLLSRSPIKKVSSIHSKPEVFGQCRNWIEKNLPLVELADSTSTTKAAELASKKRGVAAIGSILAAEVYGLNVLAKDIEDSAHNVTRFLVISRNLYPRPTRSDKTSLVFSIKDRVGALHDMLVPFKKNSVNLTKIESRPSKERAWDYYFFVDTEGHISTEKVKRAVANLSKVCTYLKILGSYPVGR